MNRKKAQAWGFDLTIAMMIFLMGIIIFYMYTLNYSNEGDDKLKSLEYEGNLIAESILSEGSPLNWNSSNVLLPGIVSENKINQEKMEEFYLLVTEDYEKTKLLFNTRYDYYFNFSKPIIIEGNTIEGIGKKPDNPENLLKITKIVNYENTPVNAYLQIWE